MNALLFILGWLLPVATVLMWLHLRAVKRRHRREVANIIDDAITARDKLTFAKGEITRYQRVQLADSQMIERLLRSLEEHQRSRIRIETLLSHYRSLSSTAYMHCQQHVSLVSPRQYQLLRQALRQLYNLEKDTDAGQSTNPGDGSAADSPTA